MLLNEAQQLRRTVEQQAREIAERKEGRAEIQEIKWQLANMRTQSFEVVLAAADRSRAGASG